MGPCSVYQPLVQPSRCFSRATLAPEVLSEQLFETSRRRTPELTERERCATATTAQTAAAAPGSCPRIIPMVLGPIELYPDTFHNSTLLLQILAGTSPTGAREPFRANARGRAWSDASRSTIPATYAVVQPVSRTTGSSVVASSCDPADGRQERRRVAPEASDGPILPPIGGIAKQAGFAERRYVDQLHRSDRGLRC